MMIDTATVAVVISTVFGGGGIVYTLLSSVLSRKSDKADIADKVTQATDRILTRYDTDLVRLEKKLDQCETRGAVIDRQLQQRDDEYRRLKTAFRIYMRAVESGDPAALETASQAARDLLV